MRGGRLVDGELDPRVLRLTNVEVVEAVLAAANAALEAEAAARGPALAPDLTALIASLDQARQLSQEQFDRAAEGIRRSVAQVREISEVHLGRG